MAPERVERGLQEALAGERALFDDEPLSLLRFRGIGWIDRLRFSWDSLNYGWQRWVLGYQADTQSGLLQRWFGNVDGTRLGIGLVAAIGGLLGLLALLLLKPWQRGDPQLREFQRFERLLARHGVMRAPGEGPRSFAQRAAHQLPDQAAAIDRFVRCYEAQRYAGQDGRADELPAALRQLRRALPWRRRRSDRPV